MKNGMENLGKGEIGKPIENKEGHERKWSVSAWLPAVNVYVGE